MTADPAEAVAQPIVEFPEFFREIYRLHGWEFRPGTSKRTPHAGKLIKHYIYEQLPQGVLTELERANPKNAKGNRPRKHHQHLTESTGNIHLDRQISILHYLSDPGYPDPVLNIHR